MPITLPVLLSRPMNRFTALLSTCRRILPRTVSPVLFVDAHASGDNLSLAYPLQRISGRVREDQWRSVYPTDPAKETHAPPSQTASKTERVFKGALERGRKQVRRKAVPIYDPITPDVSPPNAVVTNITVTTQDVSYSATSAEEDFPTLRPRSQTPPEYVPENSPPPSLYEPIPLIPEGCPICGDVDWICADASRSCTSSTSSPAPEEVSLAEPAERFVIIRHLPTPRHPLVAIPEEEVIDVKPFSDSGPGEWTPPSSSPERKQQVPVIPTSRASSSSPVRGRTLTRDPKPVRQARILQRAALRRKLHTLLL